MQHWGARHSGGGYERGMCLGLDRRLRDRPYKNWRSVKRGLPEAIDLAQLDSRSIGHSPSAGSHHVHPRMTEQKQKRSVDRWLSGAEGDHMLHHAIPLLVHTTVPCGCDLSLLVEAHRLNLRPALRLAWAFLLDPFQI